MVKDNGGVNVHGAVNDHDHDHVNVHGVRPSIRRLLCGNALGRNSAEASGMFHPDAGRRSGEQLT